MLCLVLLQTDGALLELHLVLLLEGEGSLDALGPDELQLLVGVRFVQEDSLIDQLPQQEYLNAHLFLALFQPLV